MNEAGFMRRAIALSCQGVAEGGIEAMLDVVEDLGHRTTPGREDEREEAADRARLDGSMRYRCDGAGRWPP